MDDATAGPSRPDTSRTGKKRKFQRNYTEEELEYLLCNSYDDPTFVLDEERKLGWYDSDDEDENADMEVTITDDVDEINRFILASTSQNLAHENMLTAEQQNEVNTDLQQNRLSQKKDDHRYLGQKNQNWKRTDQKLILRNDRN
ncbi:hypothetical protein JTB14_031189 [Gonioctena quinquepunctata]|nr:hypothetical protein JTB14_031189 [Gonioctena quinquepunctata]